MKKINILGYFLKKYNNSIPSHYLSYLEYGKSNNQNSILCAHGLTRNAYDFYKLSLVLQKDYNLIALDYPGRGNSSYFRDKNNYTYDVYVEESIKFLEYLKIQKPIIWIGSSMGGIIGMMFAAKYPSLIKGLVINDIGPCVYNQIIKKLIIYAKQEYEFSSFNDAKNHLKMIYNQFGYISEEDWDYLTINSFKLNKNNKYIMSYDIHIVNEFLPLISNKKDIVLWDIWKKINCPILVIHGMKSEILTNAILSDMYKMHKFHLYQVPYAGHTPSLMTNDQIEIIKTWLNHISNL